jgi:hypothetical protein
MSTIKADTLSNLLGTLSVPVATAVQGSAKAWVNFNGTGTVAIRASFNVSSITDRGTGQYTINFTTALADANYSLTVTVGEGSSTGKSARAPTSAPSTSAVQLETTNATQTSFEDATYVQASVFR